VRPFVEVWKINLASSIHMFTHFDLKHNKLIFSWSSSSHLHVRGWLDIAKGCMIGVSVEQVQRDWDVVVLTPIWHRDRALVVSIFFVFFVNIPFSFT